MSLKSAFLTVVFVITAAMAILCLAALVGCASREVAVSREELPQAVRATLDKESAGGKVCEIERETKHGRTVYSADVEVDGAEWDVTIAEDGTLISKKQD